MFAIYRGYRQVRDKNKTKQIQKVNSTSAYPRDPCTCSWIPPLLPDTIQSRGASVPTSEEAGVEAEVEAGVEAGVEAEVEAGVEAEVEVGFSVSRGVCLHFRGCVLIDSSKRGRGECFL